MAAITAPSLLAQSDQEFEWAIFANADLPDDARRRLDELVEPFDGRAFIDFNGHSPKNLLGIAVERDLVQADNVLTGRIDDDDAWARGTVEIVRARTTNWLSEDRPEPGFGLSFENGLVWVMYDMLDVEQVQRSGDDAIRPASLRPWSCPFTSISGFVYSPLSRGATPIAGSHSAVPKYLEAQGFEVDVIAGEDPMWLYCRHKQTDSAVARVADQGGQGIDIGELSRAFGIDETRTRDYIEKAERHGYSTTKRLFERRGELRRAFMEANQRITDSAAHASERSALEQRVSRLRSEHETLGENLIAEPAEGAGPAAFRHVIQTRFSVRARWGFQEFPLAWLRERLELFDAYCLPSVAAQTCEDFLWHVYCDESTDESILRELQERAQRLPQMRIAITGPGGREPPAHVAGEARVADRALLTTRLDSDDAISKHYVGAIQAHVREFVEGDRETLLLNFPRGYQLDAASGRLLFDWMPRSSFHTLFERVEGDVKTVLSGNHSTFHQEHPTEQDDSIPAWLMVIHGGNVINTLREYYTGEASRERLADFSLPSAVELSG